MDQYSYFFENSQLLTLFVSAFDGAFVQRYDAKTRLPKEKIKVRYVNGPKNRVLADLTDRAKVLTLPVVAIEETRTYRDTNRVFHKGKNIVRKQLDSTNRISSIPTPIPMNLDLKVNIIAYFKEDIDQIIQNFVVNCNPYIIVSWKTPDDFGLPFTEEIRSEVQWSGDGNWTNPNDLSPETKWRVSYETSFTIKGWFFKSIEQDEKPIYVVNADFRSLPTVDDLCSADYNALISAPGIETERVSVSAYPVFTNTFFTTNNNGIAVNSAFTIDSNQENNFTLLGKNFDHNNSWYLSGGPGLYTNFETISTAKFPTISGFRLPDNLITVQTDNIVNISLTANMLSAGDNFSFISVNAAGWGISDIIVVGK